MPAEATPSEVQEDKHQDQDESDNPKDFHPAWCAGVAVGLAGRIGFGGQVSHVRVL